jgi:DnaK suppressor protein
LKEIAMTQTDLRDYRRRLQLLSARLRGDVSELCEEAFDSPDAVGAMTDIRADPSDIASHEAERDVTLCMLGNEQDMQKEVEAALHRLAAGAFGRCEDCGTAISQNRLYAIPYARYCIGCAERGDMPI